MSPMEFRFEMLEQIQCLTDNNKGIFNLTCFLGGFYYQLKVVNTDRGKYVGFRIDNRTDLESGTVVYPCFCNF